MPILLPVASGKGGVGKSVTSANLALAIAELGKTVVLVDLDLGGANLHTILGLKNRYAGIGGLVHRTERDLSALVIETPFRKLFFIPGDTLLPGTANLDFFLKTKILRGLEGLPADYVIMDLGAGSSYNVVDFFLSSSSGLVVTIPEITSILNAYSFLKTVLFRAIYRSFPPKGPERQLILDFASKKIEGTGDSFKHLVDRLSDQFPETTGRASELIASLYPRVLINSGKSSSDLHVGSRLREIVGRNLGLSLEYIGFLPKDDAVPRSVVQREPVLINAPNAPYSRTIRTIARRIVETPAPVLPKLYQDNEDLLTAVDVGLSALQEG